MRQGSFLPTQVVSSRLWPPPPPSGLISFLCTCFSSTPTSIACLTHFALFALFALFDPFSGQRTRRGRCPIAQRGEFSVRPSERTNKRTNIRPIGPLRVQPLPPDPSPLALSRPQPPRPLETLPRPKILTSVFFCPIWMKFGMGANNGAKTT